MPEDYLLFPLSFLLCFPCSVQQVAWTTTTYNRLMKKQFLYIAAPDHAAAFSLWMIQSAYHARV
jgi:hypothetical protein